MMSSRTDSSISALSPCACQQSLGTGRFYRDFANLTSLTVRCRPPARAAELILPNGGEFADLLRESSRFTNNLVKFLKIGVHLENFISTRFAAEAEERRQEYKRMDTGHQREELGRICGVEVTNVAPVADIRPTSDV